MVDKRNDELRYFYRNIYRSHMNKDIFKVHKSIDGVITDYGSYHNLEDALHERDILEKHGYDYELVCEDDTPNPYYDMELPPFPERRGAGKLFGTKQAKKDFRNELCIYAEEIKKNLGLTQREMARMRGVDANTVSNTVRRYGYTWIRFKEFIYFEDGNPYDLERVDV